MCFEALGKIIRQSSLYEEFVQFSLTEILVTIPYIKSTDDNVEHSELLKPAVNICY